MEAIGAVGSGILMLLGVVFLIVLAVLGILMPFFVFRIRNEMIQLNGQVSVALKLLKREQGTIYLTEKDTYKTCSFCKAKNALEATKCKDCGGFFDLTR